MTNFNKRFVNHVVTNVEDITNNYLLECDPSDLDGSASRTFKDSKLFHSDYFRPKFVYDSFIKVFPLEQLEVPETGSSIASFFCPHKNMCPSSEIAFSMAAMLFLRATSK